MNKKLVKKIENAGIVDIFCRIKNAIIEIIHVLYEGGIRFMEVTFYYKTRYFKKTFV